MKRIDLEHIIRASGAITGATEIVVVGSQAILGAVPSAPADLTRLPDLAASKIVAGREKDMAFVRSMLQHDLLELKTLKDVAAELPPTFVNLALQRVQRLESEIDKG